MTNTTERPKKVLAADRLIPAESYWFPLNNAEPMLCIDIANTLYKRDDQVHPITRMYATHKRTWQVIVEISLKLLP